MAAGTISIHSDDASAIVARFPTIIATFSRLRRGAEPIAPREDLGHAANFLYMLAGEAPEPEQVRGLETYLNTVVDHGLNASTFTARVITSTGSDLVSAVVGALTLLVLQVAVSISLHLSRERIVASLRSPTSDV